MPLVRMLVSYGPPAGKPEDRLSNTLYFNVSGSVDDPDYQALADDLANIYKQQIWCRGAKIDVRAYNMADAKPREEKAFATQTASLTWATCPGQNAVALSYYADRNLPRRRGRIFTGKWPGSVDNVPASVRDSIITFGQSLAGLGGLNVDWSVYSPTNAQAGEPDHYRISNIWVDDSWDVIRSRKIASTARSTATING